MTREQLRALDRLIAQKQRSVRRWLAAQPGSAGGRVRGERTEWGPDANPAPPERGNSSRAG